MRRLSIVPPAVLIVMLALLHGCQWPQSRKVAVSSQPPQPGIDVGQVAPDIEGDDLDGQPLHLADYRGQVVVLSFWSKS